MTETGRRRQSKWDLVSEAHIPNLPKNDECKAHSGGTDGCYNGRPCSGTNSPKNVIHNSDIIPEAFGELKSSESYPRSTDVSKKSSEMSEYHNVDMEAHKQDGLRRAEWRNDDVSLCLNSKCSEMEGVGKDRSSWDTCENRSEKKDEGGWGTGLYQNCNTSMPPDPDVQRLRSRPHSSQSRSRSRSRSRSPYHGSRRAADGRNDRSRLGAGGSLPLCKEFVAGRCRKGNQCRFSHEDGGRTGRHYDRDHHDSSKLDTWDRRYEKGRSLAYRKEESFREQVEKRDSSRDKHTYRHGNIYEEGRENRDFHRHNKSTERCLNYMRGRCQRGATCRYVHHDAPRDGESHAVDRSGEKNYDRGLSSRHEHQRVYDTPCKFFADGHCRNGQNCKFSHQALVQDHHQGKPHNDRWDHSWDNENKSSQVGSERVQTSQVDRSKTSYWVDGGSNVGNIGPYTMDRQYPTSKFQDLKPQNPAESITYQVPSQEVPQVNLTGQEQNIGPYTMDRERPTSNFQDPQPRNPTLDINLPVQEHNVGPYTMDRQCPPSNFQDPQPQNPAEDTTYQVPSSDAPQINILVQEQNIVHDTQNQPSQCDTLVPHSMGENIRIQQNSALGERVFHKDKNMVAGNSELQNMYVNNKPDLAAVPRQSHSHFDQSHYKVHQLMNPQSLDPIGQKQKNVCPSSFGDSKQQQIVYPLASGMQGLSSAALDISSMRLSQQAFPPPLYGKESQKNYSLPSNVQSHSAASQSVPDVQNFNASVQSQQFDHIPPASQLLQVGVEESSVKPNVTNATALDTNSGTSNKVVTSEQIAQISNISASLAQIFGNGQQLPQLFAALNSTTAELPPSHAISQAISVIPSAPAAATPAQLPPVKTISAPAVQSDNTLWKGRFHDPPSVSMELGNMDKKDLPHEVSLNRVQQDHITEPQSASTLAAYSVTDEPKNIADLNRSNNSVEKVENATGAVKEVTMGGDDQVMDAHGADQSKKHGRSEEAVADARADEECKKNKETKGIRMFKHALIEFAKDLLKPVWKEGNMSKEAHKTIVKKVVDKVTSTLQTNIPQTQEKIDQYLLHSKPKLSKLVQAYVEKYSKI